MLPIHQILTMTCPSYILDRSLLGAVRRQQRSLLKCKAQGQKQKLMWEALREATDEEMEKDPTVCVIGKLASGSILTQGSNPKWAQVVGKPCINFLSIQLEPISYCSEVIAIIPPRAVLRRKNWWSLSLEFGTFQNSLWVFQLNCWKVLNPDYALPDRCAS